MRVCNWMVISHDNWYGIKSPPAYDLRWIRRLSRPHFHRQSWSTMSLFKHPGWLCLPLVFMSPIIVSYSSPRLWARLITSPAQRFHLPDSTSLRLLPHYVAYNSGMFSKWHLPILFSVFPGSPSMLSHPKISP